MVTVGGLLLFAGLGGALSQRYAAAAAGSKPEGKSATAPVLRRVASARHVPLWALAPVVVAITAAAQEPLVSMLILLSPALQVVVSLVAIAPLGVALGVPFPLAIRLLLREPRERAYAWAVNGAASVLAAILATQLSLSFGHRALFVLAAGCYLAVWIAFQRRMR
jgi:hypothetical protein